MRLPTRQDGVENRDKVYRLNIDFVLKGLNFLGLKWTFRLSRELWF